MTRKAPVWRQVWWLVRGQLSLARFDLFLQGTLLLLTLLHTHTHLMVAIAAKKNDLPADTGEWVQTGVAGVEALLAPLIARWGLRHRPRALSAWLGLLAISGLLVLITTQPDRQLPPVVLCGNETIPSTPDSTVSSDAAADEMAAWVRVTLLVCVGVLCAAARLAVWTLGFTYLDDHEPNNGPHFFGILVSIQVSVAVASESWLSVAAATSPGWWRAQTSISMLLLMFSILFVMFPERMKGYPALPRPKDIKIPGLGESLGHVLKTKSILAQSLALALLVTGLWGFARNEKAYVQARYLTPAATDWEDHGHSRLTGDILRSLVVIFFITIFRARFSGRRAEGVKAGTAGKVAGVLAAMAAIVFVVLAVLKCDAATVEGLEDSGYEQPQCSSHCQCSSEAYGLAPVCSLDSLRTYYSPCHAGCAAATNLHTFTLLEACACGAGAGAGAGRAVRGACAGPACGTPYVVYQVLYVVVLALSGASLLMQGMGIVRAAADPHRPVALGVALAFISAVAYIPGRYLYKFIIDEWCAWRGDGACLIHLPGLGTALAATSAALALGSAALCLGAFLLDRRKRLAARAL